MLYVFQMDVGQMLTFDIALLTDTVSRLQEEIARVTGIGVNNQILLLSGGQSLKADQKVMAYGAGADTNPVFLFSKLAITNQDPPLVKSMGVPRDVLSAMKERISDAIKLPSSFDTVVSRTKLAAQISDSANKILAFCNNEFKEQHLQHQGWNAVVANLEEIAQALQRTRLKFTKAMLSFLPLRDKYFTLLSNFQEVLKLLSRIPLLKPLHQKEADEEDVKKSMDQDVISFISPMPIPSNLLEWITTQGQGQSIESLQVRCYSELMMFNEEMFDAYEYQVQELLTQVTSDPNQMKELVGIERRLSDLEKRLNEAKKIAKTQADMSQAFMSQQSRLNSTPDSSILPDLCSSHKRQLMQMLEGQQRIEGLQSNFRKSKQEMSTNIHQRLGWVVHVETQVSQLDSDLIFRLKTLRILEVNFDLLSQIKAAPRVYADMVVEAARRKIFSLRFTQWADGLVEESSRLYEMETKRREQFSDRVGEHFLLHTLFKGFEDMPPNFATKAPQVFDEHLPSITYEDIALLRSTVPELEESLSLQMEVDPFLGFSGIKRLSGSFMPPAVLPNSQSSQTEWPEQVSRVPCVITATEAPPTKFTLPELQDSGATEYLPALSSLTETMRDVMTPAVSSLTGAMASNLLDTTQPVEGAMVDSEVTTDSVRIEVSHKQHVATENKDGSVNVSDSTSGDQAAPQCGKSQRETNSFHTNSTSPHSSNEFATADFYIEDVLPSPMADSLPEEGAKRGKSGNNDADTIASLQNELVEKIKMIQELEVLLKHKEQLLPAKGRESIPEDSSSLTLVGPNPPCAELSTSTLTESDNMEIIALEHVQEKGKQTQSSHSIHGEELERKMSISSRNISPKAPKEHEIILQEKDKTIRDLESRIDSTSTELSLVKEDVRSKESALHNMQQTLDSLKLRNESLETDVSKGEESLVRVRGKLLEFMGKMRNQLPQFRQNLGDLKSFVVGNKTDVSMAVASALNTVEREVHVFNASVLAGVNAEFVKEREALLAEIDMLKADIAASKSEHVNKIVQLNNQNEELLLAIKNNTDDFALKFEEQQKALNTSVRDLETKHSLEMELEVDKCKTEMRKHVEELEKNVECLNQVKEDLLQEVLELKQTMEREKEEVDRTLKESVLAMERKHAAEKDEMVAQMTQQFQSDFDEKMKAGNDQIAQLKVHLETLEASMIAARDTAVRDLQEQLNTEHEVVVSELEQKVEESRENLAQVLEERQLIHTHKLTELKTMFDMERESLLSELSRYKDLAMTHTETQTDLGLLADVISLTSSASYGSEEMIMSKQSVPQTEDKDTNGDGEPSKMQQTISDLTAQLTGTQENILKLEDEIATLRKDKEEMRARLYQEDGARVQAQVSDTVPTGSSEASECMESVMRSGYMDTTTSFILMDKETPNLEANLVTEDALKLKDTKIAQLEKKMMEMSHTVSEDKVAIKGCDKGDLVLLCLDERHDQYVVFTVGTNLHFLHSESLDSLGLKAGAESSCKKTWILAEVIEKEYCLAKKPNNRFRVPQGTCFYRVKCKPWKSDCEVPKSEREIGKYGKVPKTSHGIGARPKKSDKK